jgi:hypothetical protein
LQRKEKGEDVHEFDILCQSRMKKVVKEGESPWLNENFNNKRIAYCEKYKQVKGKDADPYKEPIDAEVAMLAGEGMKNGRLYIADGSVDTSSTPSLSQLRATRTSGKPGIETRIKPSVVMFNEMQVCSSRARSEIASQIA